MIRHSFYLLLLLISSITVSSCSGDDAVDFERKAITVSMSQIADSIQQKLSVSPADSISSRVIYVNPQVTVNHANSSNYNIYRKVFLPIAVMLIVFACPVLMVYFFVRARVRIRQQRNEIVRYSIEKQVPLPREFFVGNDRNKDKLQSGIVWVFVGIAVFLFGMWDEDYSILSFSLVPFGVGVARIVVSLPYFRRVENEDNEMSGLEK